MTATKVHMAVYDTLADWEVGFATAHITSRAGSGSRPVRSGHGGESREPATTMGGVRVTPDMSLADLRPQDSAMLILAGADTWLEPGGNAAFAGKAREFLDAGVPVAAICGATAGLAAEGLLDDRRHTSNAAEFLAATGYGGAERYVDEPAVTDGDLITASATAPVEFAREVFARLDVYEPPVLVAWYKLYGLHDPAGYFELMAATS